MLDMDSLVPVRQQADILPAYQDTPIAHLLAYHNLNRPHRSHDVADVLVGMCMDHRMNLRIPANFAYIMRTGGANLRGWEFQISFALTVGGARAIALIGHDQCGMTRLARHREAFVSGLVERAGWHRDVAEKHFDEFAPRFEVSAPADFVRSQAIHLRQQYPRVVVASLMWSLADGMLHQIDDGMKGSNARPPVRQSEHSGSIQEYLVQS